MTRAAPNFPGVLTEANVELQECVLIPPVRVGFRSYSNGSLLRNVTVGRFTSIGRRCSIGAARHSLDTISSHPHLAPKNFIGAPLTTIGSDVWIGDNVVVAAGVTIGHGAAVGAGAVVTHDIEPYTITAGVPAQSLRRRFAPELIEQLLASNWWEHGDELFQGLETREPRAILAKLESAKIPVLPSHFASLKAPASDRTISLRRIMQYLIHSGSSGNSSSRR
jgi:virginiamycin A acetyltransferase